MYIIYVFAYLKLGNYKLGLLLNLHVAVLKKENKKEEKSSSTSKKELTIKRVNQMCLELRLKEIF